MIKILFICHANICRSPMAEYIFKNMMREYGDVEIASAGLSGEKRGQDMTAGAKECLSAHGVPFENRRAAVFCMEDYFKYDMVICMDEWTKFKLINRCIDDPMHKIFKLLEFSRVNKGMSEDDFMLYTDVTDPYFSQKYEQTFSEIFEGCVKLKEKVLLLYPL